MKNTRLITLVAVLAAVLFVGMGSFFIVREGQQAIVTQFGKPLAGPYSEAGLYFKLPLIQEVHLFDKRILKWDGRPNEIPTRDKKYIWVDTTARWRIVDPLRFLQTVANETGAASRLDDIIDSVVRDMVSSNLLVELVRSASWDPNPPKDLTLAQSMLTSAETGGGGMVGDTSTEPVDVKVGREKITRHMLAEAAKLTPQYGIELIDVQIKRINYVESVQKRVFERMISERKRIASLLRSEGEGEKRRILGTMEKELARIRSEAYKQAQEIRGQGDAQATQIYGQAFGRDPQFYALFKTLETYGSLPEEKLDLILSTDSEYLRYLKRVP
ncbi:MAG: protease modulator HflC [Desulfarculus sp.]|nr:protease modulator HflC [Desulfarculus sp.]